ncbi:MAG TPA: cytochrome c maturation protein CcmE [Candidatus Acidoferrales bacterium]|nr:cytochrome c maturation protein CcmE [Candidatus Acidoferrales bacterium]
MKARAKFSIGAVIIVATLAWLGWVGAAESKTYYHTIGELASLQGSALHQRMRVSGWIEKGSIQRLTGRVDFVLQEDGRTLPVSYVGSDPLPDTFTDGAQALAQGRLMPDGRFVAEQVQAKCASKYVAAPGQPGPSPASQPQRPASGPTD